MTRGCFEEQLRPGCAPSERRLGGCGQEAWLGPSPPFAIEVDFTFYQINSFPWSQSVAFRSSLPATIASRSEWS